MRPIDSYVGSVSTFSIAITSVYGGLGAWGMLRLAFDGSSVTDLWLLVSAGFGVGAFTALLPAFAARYLGVNVEITSESRTPN
jgi:hypothetical protein